MNRISRMSPEPSGTAKSQAALAPPEAYDSRTTAVESASQEMSIDTVSRPMMHRHFFSDAAFWRRFESDVAHASGVLSPGERDIPPGGVATMLKIKKPAGATQTNTLKTLPPVVNYDKLSLATSEATIEPHVGDHILWLTRMGSSREEIVRDPFVEPNGVSMKDLKNFLAVRSAYTGKAELAELGVIGRSARKAARRFHIYLPAPQLIADLEPSTVQIIKALKRKKLTPLGIIRHESLSDVTLSRTVARRIDSEKRRPAAKKARNGLD